MKGMCVYISMYTESGHINVTTSYFGPFFDFLLDQVLETSYEWSVYFLKHSNKKCIRSAIRGPAKN